MNTVDRELIVELLQDESRSLRDIAREAGCSDWTVRRISRQLRGDSRPMKNSANSSFHDYADSGSTPGWTVAIGLLVLFGAALWFALRRQPPE